VKKKVVVAAAILIAIVGLGAAAVPLAERYSAHQIKAGIEMGGGSVDSVEVGLLDRRVTLGKLHVRQVGDITIDRWQASGLAWPLGELLQGRTPLYGLRLGDPLQAEHLEVTGMRIEADGASWSVGSLAIDRFDLGRYESADVGSLQFVTLAARIASALSVSRFEQKQSVYTSPGTNDRTAIGAFTIEHFDHGQIGSVALARLEATPRGASAPVLALADLKLEGLDLTRPLKALSSPAWRPGMPLGRVGLEKGSASGFSGVGLERYGITLGSVTTETTHEGKDVSHARTRVEGFVFSPPITGLEAIQARLVLQAMGLKEIRLSFDCAGTEDRAKGELAVDRCVLAGPELGEITLSVRLVRADGAFWQAIDEGDAFAIYLSKAALGGAKLVIADKGLLERSLKAVASTTGRSLPELRTLVAHEVRQFQPSGMLITDDLTKLLDTVARFVETGGTLTVEARPDPPVGLDKMSYFRTPGPDWVSLLGLSATLSR
jgi:hypothetical protein